MEFSPYDDQKKFTLSKFESMLKTNNILFFDSNEFENIIHHYLDLGKITLAKKGIKVGLEQHPSSINLQLLRVEILIFENKLNAAERLLQQLFEIEPSNEELYIQKANILSKKNKHNEAIKVFKHVLVISKDAADIYSLIGMEYLFLENYKEAKTYFLKCINIDKDDYSALYNLIYCFELLEEQTDAIKFLNSYLDRNPYSEVGWHQLGKQYVLTNELENALSAFDFAIISDDTFIGAYLEKAKIMERLNRFHEAIENYQITVAIEDPTAFAMLRIGHCYDKLGDSEKAVEYFNKAIVEDPMLDKAWIAITEFYIKNKDYNKALYFINKAIDNNEDHSKYWLLFAIINESLNFLEEAERAYKHVLELGDTKLSNWLSRGDILIQIGEYEAAQFNFIQAANFHSNSEEIEYRLAGICFLTQNSNQGYKHLQKGFDINPAKFHLIQELFGTLLNESTLLRILEKFQRLIE